MAAGGTPLKNGLGGIPEPASGHIRQDKLSFQEAEETGETQASIKFYNCVYIVMDLVLEAGAGRQPSGF